MRDVPAFVDAVHLSRLVRHWWGVAVDELRYLDVGGGAYHWKGVGDGRAAVFITCDDLTTKPWLGHDEDEVFRRLTVTYRAAARLRDNYDLAFVTAPLPTTTGEYTVRLDATHCVAVLSFVEGRPGVWGEPLSESVLSQLMNRIAALHDASPAGLGLDYRDLTLPGRDALMAAIDRIGTPWRHGPLAELARRLLQANLEAVNEWLSHLDGASKHQPATAPVLTHGEPHPGNVLHTSAGMVLVDWDTLAVGPAERDLWMFHTDSHNATQRYTRRTGRPVDPELLTAYRRLWALSDVAAFIKQLRRPHTESPDAVHALQGLHSIFSGDEPRPWA